MRQVLEGIPETAILVMNCIKNQLFLFLNILYPIPHVFAFVAALPSVIFS